MIETKGMHEFMDDCEFSEASFLDVVWLQIQILSSSDPAHKGRTSTPITFYINVIHFISSWNEFQARDAFQDI